MSTKMTCREMLGSLCDYVDGEATEELCRAIERHLAECPDCRIVVDTTRKTVQLVHAADAECDCPEDVKARLFKALNLDTP
jgi:anti-sigma factor RsiW